MRILFSAVFSDRAGQIFRPRFQAAYTKGSGSSESDLITVENLYYVNNIIPFVFW